MPILAQIENKLILDIFGEKLNIEKVSLFVLNNNVLVYCTQNKLVFYDVLGHKIIKEHIIFCKASKIKLTESGENVGVINEDNVFFVFNKEKQLFMHENVVKFDISDKVFCFIHRDMCIIQNVGSSVPFHRSSFIYLDFFVYDDFCILGTRKSLKENCHKILKISECSIDVLQTFEKLEEFKCKANTDNTYVLTLVSTSYAKNSYFAHTILYIFDVKKDKFKIVPKVSNISDFVFLKEGFAVSYGVQPALVSVFDFDLNIKMRFPKGLRNRLYFNSFESYAAFAGFEQLSGDVEIYDLENKEKLAEINQLGASNIEWETNGSYFYISTTKYLKEDNKISKYDYYGTLIGEESFDALVSSKVYGSKSEFLVLQKPKIEPVKQNFYVPPHLANRTSIIKKEHKLKSSVGKPKDNIDSLEKALKEIEKLKDKMKKHETISMKEMNLILSEETIRKKLEKIKK